MKNERYKKNFQPPTWSVEVRGSNISQLQLMTIKGSLDLQLIPDYSLLNKIAIRISRSLQFNLGKGKWNVLILHGETYAKKLVASGNYYAILKRNDGLVAFIWLNKFAVDDPESL